jgi:hypothetical protein
VQQIGALQLRCFGQWLLEDLTYNAEGEVALQLGPPRPENTHSAVCRRRPRLSEQRRFANPGRPFDHQEPASSRASLV